MLKGKNIVLAVTGSIAAYKIANLASMLGKLHAKVTVLMTANATNFINPITFETLTGNKCLIDTFDRNFQYNVEHVSLAKETDLVLVAPASANVIGKIANGIADDMLTTTVMACSCKKIIAPAMNTHMYLNPIVQDNMDKLRRFGMEVITPDTGHLGKMGDAIAENAMVRGADVTLITGKSALTPPLFVNVVPVISAQDMFDAVRDCMEEQDIIIKAAAVADYRPVNPAEEKIKKQENDMSIRLERTDDILGYIGEHKKPGQFICGFSMETQNMIENSRKKLLKKKADMIVANNLKQEGAGFGADTNIVTFITADDVEEMPIMSKEEVAFLVVRTMAHRQMVRHWTLTPAFSRFESLWAS